MALTATATKTLRDAVINTLGMVNSNIVSDSPDKPNLVLSVHQCESMEESFKPLVDKLHKERTSMGRTLVTVVHKMHLHNSICGLVAVLVVKRLTP